MRVFLSYASEFHAQAEEVAMRLRAAGHRVFFAPEDLPGGDSNDDRIRNAIGRSHAFLCFLTPEYLTPGRYTLTELEIARRRWPSPAGHVFPIRLANIPVASIPAYLRAVTIIEPKGNLPAELVMALSRPSRLPRLKPYQAVLVLAVVVVTAGVFFWLRIPHMRIGKPEIRLESRGYAGGSDIYAVTARVEYQGPEAELKQGRIEFSRPQQGQEAEWTGQTLPLSLDSGLDLKFSVSLAMTGKSTDLRVCALVRSWSCGPWTTLTPQGPEGEIPEAILHRVNAVAESGDSFVVALSGPNEVARVGSGGRIVKSAQLSAKPIAIAAAGPTVYVACASPDSVSAFDVATLELRWQLPVAFPGRTQTGAGEAVSTEVHSIAANSAGVWIDTGNGAGSVLAYADPQNKKWVVPRYQDDVAFDLRDVDLASAGDLIQGAETGSTPANMYLFYPDHYVLLDGHKYDEVGCASGAAQSSSARLYLVNCDGTLLTGEIQQTNFKVAARIGTLPEWPASNTSSWTTWVMTAGRQLALAANVEHPNAANPKEGWRTQIYGGESGAVPKLIATVPDVHVTSLAVAAKTIVAVAAHADGRREGIEIPIR